MIINLERKSGGKSGVLGTNNCGGRCLPKIVSATNGEECRSKDKKAYEKMRMLL